MRGGVRAFCGAALLCALLAFAGVARAADVESEVDAELALEAEQQMEADMTSYTEMGVAALQSAQVAAGMLTQAEADAGLVVARVVNTRITDRLTADVVARLTDDDGSTYDEAFAKQASDYSAAAYYDGDPASALNYQQNANNFELGTKATANYYGGDVSAYTGIDKNKNLIVVGYEGTSHGPKQLVAEGVLGFGRNVPNCPGCKTTQYFGAAQDKLYPQISQSVKDLEAKCPTCKVLVTGHSLGGAMAQNGAYQMMKDGTLKKAPTFYTFGQPKTGNPEYNAEFNKLIPNAYRVTHDTDLVPTVGARAKGTNIGQEISYNDAMTQYQKCDGAGCGNKLKSELIADAKQNAKDTLGKPLPTWDQVFSHPLKSAGDVLKRPIDFVKKEASDVKQDVTNSVDQHIKYFDKDLGSEFNSQDPKIKAFQAEQDAKAKADPTAADPAAQTRGMPQPLMAMPPGMGDDKDAAAKDPAADKPDGADKPKPALGAAAPGADGADPKDPKDPKEEKLEDKPSSTADDVKKMLNDDKDKKKAKDKNKAKDKKVKDNKAKDKKKQKQPAKSKAKKDNKKKKQTKKQTKKSNKKQPKKTKKQAKKKAAAKKQKKQPKKQAKKQKSKVKKQKKKQQKKPKKSAAKKQKKKVAKRAPKKSKRAAKKPKRAPKKRAAKKPKRAAKRRAAKRRAAKRRAPKRRAPKRRAPKRRAPKRRAPRGAR